MNLKGGLRTEAIIWKRTLASKLLVEIVLPVLLMSFLCYIRGRIPVQRQSNLFQSDMIPFATTITPMMGVEWVQEAYRYRHEGRGSRYTREFLKQDPFHSSFIFKLHPDNCRRTRTSIERIIIGVTSNVEWIAENLSRDLSEFRKLLNG